MPHTPPAIGYTRGSRASARNFLVIGQTGSPRQGAQSSPRVTKAIREDFTRKLTELRDAVLDHAKHEEYDEFSKLGQELSTPELENMGRAAKLAEAIAPTRPHPGVESQVARLLARPFAAMLDRARDAIVGKG